MSEHDTSPNGNHCSDCYIAIVNVKCVSLSTLCLCVFMPLSVLSLSLPPFLPPSLPVYTHPYGTPLYDWSVDDVGEFLSSLGYEAYIDKFAEHEIDGRALSLVRDHHLLMTMKLRLGPTLKICEHVQAIKNIEEAFEE